MTASTAIIILFIVEFACPNGTECVLDM